MNGRFYGKVIDSTTSKPIEFASVQLSIIKKDTITKGIKKEIVAGQFTEANGDFSFDKISPQGKYSLKIYLLGYQPYEKDISFSPGSVNKDLGNIKLTLVPTELNAVIIEGTTPSFEVKLDKKVFNVDKNITSSGGTAEDVLKNVPSVTVDMDGNVQMRNSAPQIFVDGKPTTLTLDQIPADAMESVEVITNPSAKYDASGGQAGILNIVLKKNRKIGYNGNIRAGIDKRGKANAGGDINAREKKINIFLSGNFNQRKSISVGKTERYNLFGESPTNILQKSQSVSQGVFASGRAGFDWFIDNRNTLTLSGNYTTGSFLPEDILHARTDTLNSLRSSTYERISLTSRQFKHFGPTLQFKHLFPKEGQELTADINYNLSKSSNTGHFETNYFDDRFFPLYKVSQRQEGAGSTELITAQSDYVNIIKEKVKLEAGIRGSRRVFNSGISNFLLDLNSNEFILLNEIFANYTFNDQVYAAYTTVGHKIKKFSYLLGLRAESSYYNGEFLKTQQKFKNEYPLSLFPSVFGTYELKENDNVQISYTRKINRPNFFQLSPYIDYSDSLNLSRGNEKLKPEFTNSFELSYLKSLQNNSNILVSAYYKNTNDLITRYQETTFNPLTSERIIINTYQNANSSYTYGGEITSKTVVKKWLDFTVNLNIYNAIINAGNIETNLINQQWSWFAKWNSTIRLPKGFNVQLSADYHSKTTIPTGRGEGRGHGGGGGGMWGGGSSSVTQGYILPRYSLDIGIRKELLKNKASLSLNINDVFKTQKNISYSENLYFKQTTFRQRDPQFVRLTFSYRFGKFDASLFKRKNMNSEGVEMGM